jgi:hypothetical protein
MTPRVVPCSCQARGGSGLAAHTRVTRRAVVLGSSLHLRPHASRGRLRLVLTPGDARRSAAEALWLQRLLRAFARCGDAPPCFARTLFLFTPCFRRSPAGFRPHSTAASSFLIAVCTHPLSAVPSPSCPIPFASPWPLSSSFIADPPGRPTPSSVRDRHRHRRPATPFTRPPPLLLARLASKSFRPSFHVVLALREPRHVEMLGCGRGRRVGRAVHATHSSSADNEPGLCLRS